MEDGTSHTIYLSDDYILSLKDNQSNLHEDVATYFTSQLSPEAAMVTVDGGHGRMKHVLFV